MRYWESLGEFSPRINITYRCQLFSYCEYCYARDELRNYPNDMDIQDFSNIIGWFKELFGIRSVTFLGGECTVHPDLKSFLRVLDEEDTSCFLFTNGCFNDEVEEVIENSSSLAAVIFHYEPSFLRENILRDRFLRNLRRLSRNKEIIFRFNTGEPFFEFKELVELSEKYNASIAYSLTSPSLNKPNKYVSRGYERLCSSTNT